MLSSWLTSALNHIPIGVKTKQFIITLLYIPALRFVLLYTYYRIYHLVPCSYHGGIPIAMHGRHSQLMQTVNAQSLHDLLLIIDLINHQSNPTESEAQLSLIVSFHRKNAVQYCSYAVASWLHYCTNKQQGSHYERFNFTIAFLLVRLLLHRMHRSK